MFFLGGFVSNACFKTKPGRRYISMSDDENDVLAPAQPYKEIRLLRAALASHSELIAAAKAAVRQGDESLPSFKGGRTGECHEVYDRLKAAIERGEAEGFGKR